MQPTARHAFLTTLLSLLALAAAGSSAEAASVNTVNDARTRLSQSLGGPLPLFFTTAAFSAAGIRVDHVDVGQLGDGYSATVFYGPIDGGEYLGQLWISRSPAAEPAASFETGSCRDHEVVGPQQIGPFADVYESNCDISMIYRFSWAGRLYTVGSKYYGGLDTDSIPSLVASLTEVARRSSLSLGSLAFAGDETTSEYPGFGTVRPKAFGFGGDPSSYVSRLRWRGWGHRTATATGRTAYNYGPGKWRTIGVRARAYDIGICGGQRAYRKIQLRFHTHRWSRWSFPWKYLAAGGSICARRSD